MRPVACLPSRGRLFSVRNGRREEAKGKASELNPLLESESGEDAWAAKKEQILPIIVI